VQGIGWGVGSLGAGAIYDYMGDKANLAIDYLSQHYNITDVARTEAMERLVQVSGMTHQEATNILWNQYDPYELWYPFAAIGILSAVGMYFYGRWVKKTEAEDV